MTFLLHLYYRIGVSLSSLFCHTKAKAIIRLIGLSNYQREILPMSPGVNSNQNNNGQPIPLMQFLFIFFFILENIAKILTTGPKLHKAMYILI